MRSGFPEYLFSADNLTSVSVSRKRSKWELEPQKGKLKSKGLRDNV